MKRVCLILALVFVSPIIFTACENKLEEIEVKVPTSQKKTEDDQEHDPIFF